MKNLYTFILTLVLVLAAQAQDLANKIPSDANVVVTVKGKNVLQLLSLKEFSESKLGQQMVKEINRETKGELGAIEDLGLNLKENFYYFLQTKDGVFYNTFMIPFSDTDNMTKLFLNEWDEVITDGEASYVQKKYDGSLVIWNKTTMAVVIPSDQSNDYYDDYGYYDYNDYSIPPVAAEETLEAVEEVEETVIEAVEATETVEEYAEEVVIPKPTASAYDYDNNSEYQKDIERKRLERRAKRDERQQAQNKGTLDFAKQLLIGKPPRNILQNNSYKKSLGKGGDEAMVWMNDFSKFYKEMLPKDLLGPANPYEFLNLDEIYGGMTLTGRLNFEEDQAVMGMEYTMNDALAKAYKPMYNGKFNKNFLSYINEDRLLGYLNVNLSTQGILEAYPSLIETMFTGKKEGADSKAETIAAATTSITRLFSLLIDEEGASKIIRGDMLLLLTDLREKEVTYVDYEYDEDYNYKKIKKTKTETVPDFLFLFTSEEEKMFKNFMKIGVSEKKVDYQNGIYFIDASGSNPFDIHVMYHDNTVFIGSSLEHLSQIRKGTYPAKLSNQLKKDIRNNATSFYINGKSIVSRIPSEAFPRELRDNIDFLTNNTEDLKVNFSKIKGNTMSGEMILQIPDEGHKNSLAYFFNLVDKLME